MIYTESQALKSRMFPVFQCLAFLCLMTLSEAPNVLYQMFLKERLQLFKRNDVHLIVKVGVVCTRDNE